MRLVLLVLALGATCALAPPNCHAPDPPVPGGTTQCNPTLDCDFCSRNHLSFDFLCCESGTWIGTHLTNPLLLYLVWNSVPYTIIFVFTFELFEVLTLTVARSFGLLFSSSEDLETMAASLIGDVLLQGGMGLLLGYAIRIIWVVPTLVSSPERGEAYGLQWRRYVAYMGTYLVLVSTYILPSWETSSGFRAGLLLHALLVSALIVLAYGVLWTTPRDDALLWRRLDGTLWPRSHRYGFLATWVLTILLAELPHVIWPEPSFAINEWYQQWLIMGPYAAILVIVAFFLSTDRHDGRTTWTLLAIVTAGGAFAFFFAYAIVQTLGSGYTIAGILVGVVALVFFLIGSAVTWMNSRIPGIPPPLSLAASTATRASSRAIFDESREREPMVTGQDDAAARASTLRRRNV